MLTLPWPGIYKMAIVLFGIDKLPHQTSASGCNDQVVILDEAHKIKDPASQRTKVWGGFSLGFAVMAWRA